MSTIEGHIFFENGIPAITIAVRVYNRGFGGAETLLGEGNTDEQGHYKVSYPQDDFGSSVNLEVRTVDPNGNEISLSETKFNAAKDQVLNLVVPASIRPLTPEYSRLVADLEKHLHSTNKLADAQENGERSDISVLHHMTGWDARIISLLVKATKLSEEIGIQEDILYALFRVGLPSDKQMLASVNNLVIEEALKKAKDAGIIGSNLSTENAKKSFDRFAYRTLHDAKAPGTLSSTAELINKSVLSDNEKSTFENLFLTYEGSPAELWRKTHEKGISDEKIKGLRLQGKLAHLTLNNAWLTEKLQELIQSPENLSRLVELDLYTEQSWKDFIIKVANGSEEQALGKIIPPAYEGQNITHRLDAYCADLARKVRLSFPTKVIGWMIKKGELGFSKDNNSNDKIVANFLNKAEKLGFQLGQASIDEFIQTNKEHLFSQNTSAEKIEAAKKVIKKLERLYQIAPSNKSLDILLKQDFASANEIVAFSRRDFLSSFGHLFPSLGEADLVYSKSQQVSAVTHNFLTTAKIMDNIPQIYAMSSSADETGGEEEKKAKMEIMKNYPTMESLSGSLDFCECEHCRVVLSPAAYFVDLLGFLEPSDRVWKQFLDRWKYRHNQEDYMKDWVYDRTGERYPGERKKPYYALLERRPDLPHLALSCENTNTALPYIDVVNEIFEYYVADSNLDKYKPDTGSDTTTSELLAEPQNILPIAYRNLKRARYPLTLPFDLWLETVRMFFNHFETPLWQVLDVFFLQREQLFALPSKPAIENPTNITNATVTVPAAAAATFKPGNAVTYLSSDVMHSETKIISSICTGSSCPDGVDVPPQKALITLAGTWAAPPVAGARLILADRTYNWSNIFSEYLGISSAEGAIFSDPNPMAKWWELYGYATQDETTAEAYDPQTGQRIDLNSAKTLSRRLGVSYKDLVDLIQTAFINPKLDVLVILRKLEIDVKDVFRYKNHHGYEGQWFTPEEQAAFEERLDDYTKKYNSFPQFSQFNARNWLEETWQNHGFDNILVLTDSPNSGCDFDKTLLRYADTTSVANLVFLKINLFVRLWKKLGWTIEETDQVIRACLPTNLLPVTEQNLGKAMQTALVYIAHVKEISNHANVGKNGPIELVTLWSRNISTRGRSPLYDQLFLTHGSQDVDPVFDDPLGNYLPSRDGIFVKDNLLKLQAALNLKAEEIKEILESLGKNFDEVPLTLRNVSLLYRHSLLAKAQGISIHDLMSLKQLSELEVFTAIEPNAIVSIKDDHPYQQTLEFIKVIEKIKESAFKVEDLNFLLRHVFDDPLGKYRSKTEGIVTIMQRLGSEISRIQAESALNNDNTSKEKKQALIRQLVIQSLAANLNVEEKFTEMLISSKRILSYPPDSTTMDPAKPLLDIFTAMAQNGVSVVFFNDNGNQSGEKRNIGTVNTAAKINNVPVKPRDAKAARFDGYLEVPNSGDYRFFLVFTKEGLEASLRLSHLSEPLIDGQATADVKEIENVTRLEAGKLYRFSVDVNNLNTTTNNGDVSLLVKGENLANGVNLAKGSLSRLTLYPDTVVDRAIDSYVLLSKTLQLIQGLGLSEREIQYIHTPNTAFGKIDLSKLPTNEKKPAGEGRMKLIKLLFKQFLLLLDYSRLKRNVSSGTDDLVGIFENATKDYTAKDYPDVKNDAEKAKLVHLKPFAQLTRRNGETVRAVAERMGFAINAEPIKDDPNNGYHVEIVGIGDVKKLWRLWEALQVVEKLGVIVEKIILWATPSPGYPIVNDIRNTVKSRYEQENWQGIAQSIFDKLRQRKRDALVAYIMHKLRNKGFERVEQLLEYFLIDPSMEPVVQTSRLGLAISTVQLFIQRCLLNLEDRVHPSAIINSELWQWMKRYRLWEANRKIFLFPENWLEPEFRDDKSHLMQELENALMQGDVSKDLVDDAFYNYLKKLEELANLEIVTMYCEENPDDRAADSSSNTVHVICRSHSLPRKYFYRRYAHQVWTPWEPVTTEIQGDHIVAAMWRERLHLFWVTFLEKGKNNSGDPPPAPSKQFEIQLNWSEYYQGRWTGRQSSDFGNPIILNANNGFQINAVLIYVSEYKEEGQNGLDINLFYNPSNEPPHCFRMMSKNSPPNIAEGHRPEGPPYTHDPSLRTTTKFNISNILQVTSSSVPSGHENILRHQSSFVLVFSSNLNDIVLSPEGRKSYVTPFFYQDQYNTFFVEPHLTEIPVSQLEEWIISPASPEASLDANSINQIPLENSIPATGPIIDSKSSSIFPIDGLARYEIKEKKDWLIDPATVLVFDNHFIGSDGKLDLKILDEENNNNNNSSMSGLDRAVDIKRDSDLTVTSSSTTRDFGDSSIVDPSDYPHKLYAGQLLPSDIGLRVVDNRGMNSVLLNSLAKEKRMIKGVGASR